MITGIKKQNKITEITFDEKDDRIFICTYNTDLKTDSQNMQKNIPVIAQKQMMTRWVR